MKRNSAAIDVLREQGAQPPFVSYAKTVRMLMPLARKVAFHDERGRSLWASDGIEEAELSMQVQLLIARYVNADPHERHLNDHSDLPEPVHVFPIRDTSGVLIGALAVQFVGLPPTAAYRNYATVERMLTPLLEILRHGWRPETSAQAPSYSHDNEAIKGKFTPVLASTSPPVPLPESIKQSAGTSAQIQAPERSAPTALPAVLRQMLVRATEMTAASFGTIVLPGHPFSFNHRRSEDESDLNVSAAADAARLQMLRWLSVRNEPLIINDHGPSPAQFSSYKILAWPIRVDSGPLLALLVVFRRRQEQKFVSDDLLALQQITQEIPGTVLAELQRIHTTRTLALQYRPPAQVAATVVKPTARSAPIKESDEVALILPAYVDDQGHEDIEDEPLPMSVGAPLPSVTERIRAALANDAFELHAQRMTPLRNYERPDRFEILLRMPDKYGLQTPAAFLGAAEAGDLLPTLDLWVVRHSLSMLRLDNRLGRKVRELSINLSAASLLDVNFIDQALHEIRNSKIQRGQLGFEVTESVAIHHLRELCALAEQLQEVGCRLALDNCRIGLEIFDLLPQSSIGCIKIDGSIIRQLGISPSVNTLLETMVQRATERGIESVAEQVESHLACSTAIGAGVDYAQGYHLEAPAPLAKLFY